MNLIAGGVSVVVIIAEIVLRRRRGRSSEAATNRKVEGCLPHETVRKATDGALKLVISC